MTFLFFASAWAVSICIGATLFVWLVWPEHEDDDEIMDEIRRRQQLAAGLGKRRD